MDTGTFEKPCDLNKSVEEYKEMWMSLFDVNIISSCNRKDPDLFCASALLKTAFYSFIKLKRRLMETEELIEAQRITLEAIERQGAVVKSMSSSETSAVCFRCGFAVEDSKRAAVDESSNLKHTIQSTGNISTKDCNTDLRTSEDVISKEKMVFKEEEVEQKSLDIPKAVSAINVAGNFEHSEDVKDNCASCECKASVCSHKKERDSEFFANCVTPKKRKSQLEFQVVSPILKPHKKSRLSPNMSLEAHKSGKKLLKSPSFFPTETMSLSKDQTKMISKCGLFSAVKKRSPPNTLQVKKMVALCEKGPKEGSPEVEYSSENEEAEIILPSPVSPSCVVDFSSKGISSLDKEDTVNYKRKESKNQAPFDSEMTFFLPMEEQENKRSENECVLEEYDELISGDEEDGIPVLDSFDQVPSKNDSPSYRYQRAAVRNKKERRKLFGWECKDCEKYYEAAGLSADEKRAHLNKCSRHRDKFAPQDILPEGFWNPVFPETPQ